MHWLSTRIVIAEMGPFLGLWLFNFFQMPMKQTNKIKFYEEKSPDKNLPRHIQSQSARTVHCINRKFEFHIWSRSEDRLPVPTTKPTKSIYLKLYYSGVHKYFELLLILLFWSKMVYLCFPTIIATLCIILHRYYMWRQLRSSDLFYGAQWSSFSKWIFYTWHYYDLWQVFLLIHSWFF